MDTIDIKGNWSAQKAKLKQKFPVLTDEDLQFEKGKKEDMLEKLQDKLNKTKEEIQKVMNAL